MHRLSSQVLALLSCFLNHAADIHMFPEQSVQAHIDLQGKVMMPIHNSTFDLSMHDWQYQMEQASAISKEIEVQRVSPVMGERLVFSDPVPVQT